MTADLLALGAAVWLCAVTVLAVANTSTAAAATDLPDLTAARHRRAAVVAGERSRPRHPSRRTDRAVFLSEPVGRHSGELPE
jgi:hypothetical protein